jgi:CheY-like chemotaxis protein
MVVFLIACHPSCLAGLAIVVVGDYDDARRYLELFLRQLGAEVKGASNGFEALELIKDSLPDLVLSDIKNAGYGRGRIAA